MPDGKHSAPAPPQASAMRSLESPGDSRRTSLLVSRGLISERAAAAGIVGCACRQPAAVGLVPRRKRSYLLRTTALSRLENDRPSPETRSAFYQQGAGPTTPATSRRRPPMSGSDAPVEKPGVCHNNEPESGLGALPEQEPSSRCPRPMGLPRVDPRDGARGPWDRQTGMTPWNVDNGSPRPA